MMTDESYCTEYGGWKFLSDTQLISFQENSLNILSAVKLTSYKESTCSHKVNLSNEIALMITDLKSSEFSLKCTEPLSLNVFFLYSFPNTMLYQNDLSETTDILKNNAKESDEVEGYCARWLEVRNYQS